MSKDVSVSFEFFPPKNDEGEAALWQAVQKLEHLEPSFVSVTYGAGGSTRERTHHIISRILKETKLKPAVHLTCVNATQEEIKEIVEDYWEIGVRHIVALRGDPPAGSGKYVPTPGGYNYACDLVAGLKSTHPFEISVAAYPETHPEAQNAEVDLYYLKQKIDAGADRAITQYFFDNDDYFRFVEKAKRIGIQAPIIPGVIPVYSLPQIIRFSAMCGAKVPDWMKIKLEPLAEKPEAFRQEAAEMLSNQVRGLYQSGIRQFHFYTLNRAEPIIAACAALGIKS